MDLGGLQPTLVESTGVHMDYMEYTRSPQGVQVEYVEYTRSLEGVHGYRGVSVNVQHILTSTIILAFPPPLLGIPQK